MVYKPLISTAGSQGIIDISIGLGPQTVLMDSQDGMGGFRFLRSSIDDGDFFNGSELKEFTAHAGQALNGPQHIPHESCNMTRSQHIAERAGETLSAVPRMACLQYK